MIRIQPFFFVRSTGVRTLRFVFPFRIVFPPSFFLLIMINTMTTRISIRMRIRQM